MAVVCLVMSGWRQEEAQQQQETIEATAAQIRHLSDANNGPSFNDQFAALQKRLAKLHRSARQPPDSLLPRCPGPAGGEALTGCVVVVVREKKELDEDMTIAQMNPKDAHAKLLAKVGQRTTPSLLLLSMLLLLACPV